LLEAVAAATGIGGQPDRIHRTVAVDRNPSVKEALAEDGREVAA
jgi:hypothetical protein